MEHYQYSTYTITVTTQETREYCNDIFTTMPTKLQGHETAI